MGQALAGLLSPEEQDEEHDQDDKQEDMDVQERPQQSGMAALLSRDELVAVMAASEGPRDAASLARTCRAAASAWRDPAVWSALAGRDGGVGVGHGGPEEYRRRRGSPADGWERVPAADMDLMNPDWLQADQAADGVTGGGIRVGPPGICWFELSGKRQLSRGEYRVFWRICLEPTDQPREHLRASVALESANNGVVLTSVLRGLEPASLERRGRWVEARVGRLMVEQEGDVAMFRLWKHSGMWMRGVRVDGVYFRRL
eukprot:jgi/Chlat1/1903/Chrsp147S02216